MMKRFAIALTVVLALTCTACSETQEVLIDRNGQKCTISIDYNRQNAGDYTEGPYEVPCEITEANDSDGHD